jgi:hypothetical protein
MTRMAPIVGLLLGVLAGSQVYAQSNSSSASVMTDAELAGLRKALTNTPYSALVVHTKVEILPMSAKPSSTAPADVVTEERHVYYARVLETFRGASHASVRYEMVVERGEGAAIDSKPQIVTLCKDSRAFYWPGPGASFEGQAATISEARRVGKQLASGKSTSFSDCN